MYPSRFFLRGGDRRGRKKRKKKHVYINVYQVKTQYQSSYMYNLGEKATCGREKGWTVLSDWVFNAADVSLSAKEAQRRRAALSQSPAMQSALRATVSFMQPALFLPVASFRVYISQTVNNFKCPIYREYCMHTDTYKIPLSQTQNKHGMYHGFPRSNHLRCYISVATLHAWNHD